MATGGAGERFMEAMMEVLFGGEGSLEDKSRMIEVVGGCKRKTY